MSVCSRADTRHGWCAVLATLVVFIPLLGTASPAAAQEDDGLQVTARTVYRVEPDDGVVVVEIDYTATNTVPNQRKGVQILRTYFTSIAELIPTAATDLAARRANGEPLSVSPVNLTAAEKEQLGGVFDGWEIDLGPNLFYGQTREFTVTFRLPDGGHRNDEAWARVNPALAAFPVVARGDPGRSSVRVEFPPGFAVQTFGEKVDRAEAFGATALTADDIANPYEWVAMVVGSSDFGLARRSLDVPGIGGDLSIASWPDDTEWDAFVEHGLRDGLPVLERVIGSPWPVGDQLEIREAIAPALAGYGGWYYEPVETSEDDATIEVGEALEMDLLGHELAHAWFNDDLSHDRWLLEGLAEYFGQLMATELGEEVSTFDAVERDAEGNIALVDWGARTFWTDVGEQKEREPWAYAASYQLIRTLADEIGAERMTATLQTLFDAANPYAPSLDDPGPTTADWHDVLDAFDVVGGSTRAEDLFVEWVLRPGADTDQLDARREAQAAASELAGAGAGWDVPGVVYDALADWRFDTARRLVADLTTIVVDAQRLHDAASAIGLVPPDAAQRAYESIHDTGDIDAVRAALDEQRDTLAAVESAVTAAAAARSPLERLGLWGEDVDAVVVQSKDAFEAGAYETAQRAAADAEATLQGAATVGRNRAIMAGGALLGVFFLLGCLVYMVRRRRRRPKDPETESSAPLDPPPDGRGPDLFAGFGAPE